MGKHRYNKLLFTKTLDTKIFFITTRFTNLFKNSVPKQLKKILKNITPLGGVNYVNYKTSNKNFLLDAVLNKQKSISYFNTTTNIRTQKKTIDLIKTDYPIINHPIINLTILQNPFIFKLNNFSQKNTINNQFIFNLLPSSNKKNLGKQSLSNVLPSQHFSHIFFKKVYSSLSYNKINTNFIPIYYTTLIRFMENISGNKVLIQFYPFINQSITQDFIIKYKL